MIIHSGAHSGEPALFGVVDLAADMYLTDGLVVLGEIRHDRMRR